MYGQSLHLSTLMYHYFTAHQFFDMKSNPSSAQQILEQLEVATTTLVNTMEIEVLVTWLLHMSCMVSHTVVV